MERGYRCLNADVHVMDADQFSPLPFGRAAMQFGRHSRVPITFDWGYVRVALPCAGLLGVNLGGQ